MSKISTPPAQSIPASSSQSTASSAWSRGPPPASSSTPVSSTPTLSSIPPSVPAGNYKVNGTSNASGAASGHSRKSSIMAIGGGMDIPPRGGLAFGTVDSPNPMLSSSPAAPSVTGNHLADAVKSFGSIEADTSNTADITKPRRTSTLNMASPPPANPTKKLDMHVLFGGRPPASNAPSAAATGLSNPVQDRRQSSNSVYTSGPLPNSSATPFQPGGQPHLRPPQVQPQRSPVTSQNIPGQYSGPNVQQGFRPPMMQGPPGSQQIRPNGGQMQQGMPRQMGGMSQYGMHPQGPGYPMVGYPNNYYGYNAYEQQHQYAMAQQWQQQHGAPQNQSQPPFNLPLSPRGSQSQLQGGTSPSPAPSPAALPGSGIPSPLVSSPHPQTSNGHQQGPAAPSTPMRSLSSISSFTPQGSQTPAGLAALSAGATAFTPTPARKSAIKFSRSDGTAVDIKEVVAAAKAPSAISSGANTPSVADASVPSKPKLSLPVVVRMESEDQKKNRLLEEERKERIRKEEEKEEEERRERKERLAKEEQAKKELEKEAEEKAKKEQAEKAEIEAQNKADEAQRAIEEKEAAAKKEAQELQDAKKEAEVSDTASTSSPAAQISSPALPTTGLPPKPLVTARRTAPTALSLDASSSPSITQSPTASASALNTAKPIEDIHTIVYPGELKSPNSALNKDATPGKYRYDRDFLMQFMEICREKPETLPSLEAIGLEADPNSSSGSYGKSKPTRNSTGGSSMGPPPRGGLNISANGKFPSGGMGTFGSMGSFGAGTNGRPDSDARYRQSLAANGRATAGMNRTPSQQGSLSSMHGLPQMGQSQSRSGMNRSQRGTKRQPQDSRSSFQPDADVAPLVGTTNAWSGARTAPVDESSPMFIERKVKALLNKLTAEKFDSISVQILEWANKSANETDGMTLKLVIKLVFEKATDESHWSAMYARLCRLLLDRIDPAVSEVMSVNGTPTPMAGPALFRKYLLGRCQIDFENGWKTKTDTATAAAAKGEEDKERLAKHEVDSKDAPEGTTEAVMLSDEYYAAQKAKRRGLGLVHLIGELFKLEMLSKGVISKCLKTLVAGEARDPDEEDLESACKLLVTLGADFDRNAKDVLDQVLVRLNTLMGSDHYSSRVKFMIQDIVDLRRSGWKSRNQQGSVMTIAEVHEQAAKEQAQKTAAINQSVRDNRESISRGGSRSGHARGGQAGDWQTANPNSRPVQRQPDFSNVGRLQSGSAFSSGPSFGPSSVFNKKKTAIPGAVTPPALSRQTSNANMFSALNAEPETAPAPAEPVKQRRKLKLAPRTKPLPGEEGAEGEEAEEDEGEDDVEGEEGSEEEGEAETGAAETAVETVAEPAVMSVEGAKTQVARDMKEFWGEKDVGGSRDPQDIVEYFRTLPDERKVVLSTRLVDDVFRLNKPKDLDIVAKGWKLALDGNVVTSDVLKEGLATRMPGLDDDAIDIPIAYKAVALFMRVLSLSETDIDDLFSQVDIFDEKPKVHPRTKLDRALAAVDEDAAKA